MQTPLVGLLIVISSFYTHTSSAIPFFPTTDSSLTSSPLVSHRQAGTAAYPASPPPACPSQKPVAENLCTSGSPYCCSGSGPSQVCGPRSTTECESTTICCINTNGMQICAGEIDFTGPVTININYEL